MKLCVVSDIHLEIGGYPGRTKFLKGGGEVLIIAGDLVNACYMKKDFNSLNIGNNLEAKKQLGQMKLFQTNWMDKFKKVYYVLGNHDHYKGYFNESSKLLKEYFEGTNVKVLDNESELYKDVLFIGSTLWTDFKGNDFSEMQKAANFMNDYNLICLKRPEEITYIERNHPNYLISSGRIHPRFIYEENQRSIHFIRETLKKNPNQKTVVITHHAPSVRCHNTKRYGDEMIYAYCSNFDSIIEDQPQIKLWVSGHTHDSHDFMIGSTRLYSNQRGYAGYDPKEREFKPKFIEI